MRGDNKTASTEFDLHVRTQILVSEGSRFINRESVDFEHRSEWRIAIVTKLEDSVRLVAVFGDGRGDSLRHARHREYRYQESDLEEAIAHIQQQSAYPCKYRLQRSREQHSVEPEHCQRSDCCSRRCAAPG